jgi:hypothetical protein
MGAEGLRVLGGARGMPELRLLDAGDVEGAEPGMVALITGGAFPRLAKLHLGGMPLTEDIAAACADSPFGENMEELHCDGASAAALEALLAWPRLRRVARLRLSEQRMPRHGLQPCTADFPGGEAGVFARRMPAEVAEVLARADLPGLRWLGLHRWRGIAVPHLLKWPGLGRLSTLDLRGAPLGAEAVGLLAGSAALAGLKRLDLSASNKDEGRLAPLADSPHLRGLESLSIGQADAASCRALAASPLAHACRTGLAERAEYFEWPAEWRPCLSDGRGQSFIACKVGAPPFPDDWIVRLAQTPALAQVRELDVGQTDMTLAGLRALLASPYLTELRQLRVSFCEVGDEGAELVAGCAKLAGLLSLKMSFCSVGDAGVQALASSPYLTGLRVLKLWGDGDRTTGRRGERSISDDGARAIAGSANFRNLVALRVRENSIGDEGAVALAESPHLNDLMYLYISGNRYGPVGEAALRRRFGSRVGIFTGDPYTVGLW